MRLPHIVGDPGVPYHVRRLLDKFEYPDELGGGGPVSVGGGGGVPTLLIAADNSRDTTKAAADFVCGGTDDHLVIQSAVDVLDDEGVSGRLFLGEGTYDVNFFTLKFGITLDGARANLVKSAGTSGAMIRTDGTNFGISVVGLFLDGANIANCTAIDTGAANWTRITRCVFSDWRDYGVDHDDSGTGGNPLLVTDSSFTNIGATTGTAGIRITAGDLHVVMGNSFKNLTAGVLTVGTSGLTVIGCLTKNGVTNLVNSTGGSTGTQVIGNITDLGVSTGAGVAAAHNNSSSHAPAAHTIASHSDTTATGAELETLTDGSNADALHDHLLGDGSELTIAAGEITVTGGFHTVDTQDDDATDELDTINGGVIGQLLVLTSADAGRDVELTDGVGNLILAGANFTLTDPDDTITLIYDGTDWLEVSRSDNS